MNNADIEPVDNVGVAKPPGTGIRTNKNETFDNNDDEEENKEDDNDSITVKSIFHQSPRSIP